MRCKLLHSTYCISVANIYKTKFKDKLTESNNIFDLSA